MANNPKLDGSNWNDLAAKGKLPNSSPMWQSPAFDSVMPNWGSSFPFQFGLVDYTIQTTAGSPGTPGTPWSKVSSEEAVAFGKHAIQFTKGTTFTAGQAGTPGTDGSSVSVQKTLTYYTLPFPPQELIVDMPIPTTVYTNIDGSITEIHGGAPLRDITLNGTTGIFPGRGKPSQAKPDRNDLAESAQFLAGGALSNTSAIGQSFKGMDSATGAAMYPNVYTKDELTSKLAETGFFYYQALERFIEAYVQAKQHDDISYIDPAKSGPATGLRLVLYVWKEQIAYICSGVRLTKKKSSNSPNEIHYTLQLKAWRRVDVSNVQTGPEIHAPSIHVPNTAAQILNKLNAAKDGINEIFKAGTELNVALNSTASAINTAPDQILSPVGQSIKLGIGTVKGIQSINYAIQDFDQSIQKSIETHIIQNWDQFSQSYSKLVTPEDLAKLEKGNLFRDNATDSVKSTIQRKNDLLEINYGAEAQAKRKQRAALADQELRHNQQTSAINEQIRIDNQKLVEARDARRKELYELTEKSRDALFANINPNTLNLSPDIRKAMFGEQLSNLSKTKNDFIAARQTIKNELDTFAAKIGVLPTTYASTYNINATQTRTASDFDFKYLWSLQSALAAYDTIIASQEDPVPTLSSLDYIAGLALQSGVAFKRPIAKIAVPFPYGMTLQQLAHRYLGDVNGWHEIVALNGLRAPYIDEVGSTQLLTVNGAENYINVTDVTNLYLNQTVWLKSDTQPKQPRHILDIKTISANNHLITLDGPSDLDVFTTTDNASIQHYLPATVNSQQLLFVPSNQTPIPDTVTKDIPGVDMYDPLLQMGGVDLLLTDNNDLVVTSDGDFKLSYGLTNILQSIRILLGTVYGSVLQHPTFGLTIEPGTSAADVDVLAIQSSVKQTLAKEPYVQSVNKVQIKKTSNALQIRIELILAGISQVLPVEIQVGL